MDLVDSRKSFARKSIDQLVLASPLHALISLSGSPMADYTGFQ